MKKLLTVYAVLTAVTFLSANAFAGIMFDLTAVDGTNRLNLVPGQTGTIPLQLWVTITGADADGTNEGLLTAYLGFKTLSNTGIYGLTGFETSKPSSFAVGFQPGVRPPSGTLVAGIGGTMDLGNPATKSTLPAFGCTAGTAATGYNSYPGMSNSLITGIPGGVRMLVTTLQYGVSGVGGYGDSYLHIGVVLPTIGSGFSSAIPALTWKEDGLTSTSKKWWPGATTSATVGPGVSFITPEPSTFILLGMGALALVFVRRRK
jgi:hypothetical protein